jgi:hypothetical protein
LCYPDRAAAALANSARASIGSSVRRPLRPVIRFG